MEARVTRLANGMTVVTDRMPHLRTAALGVWVGTGSRSELPEQNGITHLLEHMAFKGTHSRSARQIAEEIEAVGGELNASTSVEHTNYHARVLAEDVPLAVELIADILQNSVFDPEELAREKHVILQEIGAAHDTPDDKVFDLFQETAWSNQAIGRPILGTPETVLSFRPEDLRTYLSERYSAPELVLSAAGAVEHEAIVALAEQHFSGLPDRPASQASGAVYTGGTSHVERDLLEVQLVLGFEGKPYRAPDYYAVQVLASVMGGGMSSRLFQEIRERRGLCYAIYAFHWAFQDSGLFGVHAATGEEDIDELFPVLVDELGQAAQTIEQADVDRSKAQIRAGLMMSLESPAARAGQIARQLMIHGHVLTPEEIQARIDKVTLERLRSVAAETFAGAPTISVVGPPSVKLQASQVSARLNGEAAQAVGG
ncbi:insulinase family protein [Stappia taiwanensis]|uniref:Insulinase family protein n=1 Tax=Stappia taiwanensis TaxID=992267 RepID=A0A838XKZ7_9HYPH|nr:pitrilysin family protein [Stappia taiwanensis]MBA4611999.1 insulinase family protein [Stappia taiwanensis]GGE91940.1 peptidase M16 [Stappia taiwanensis]